MGVTTDRDDPKLEQIRADGQQESYLVLSESELAKGYVLPVRQKYTHTACGGETRMPKACAETYARDPKFYGGTFCCVCGKHFPLTNPDGSYGFAWEPDGSPVGSSPEEYQVYLEAKKKHDDQERITALEARRKSLKSRTSGD